MALRVEQGGGTILPNFPDFTPVVNALRDSQSLDSGVTYKVCVAKLDKLCILQSFARRWTEYEPTKEETHRLIETHNANFNQGGDYMEDDERTLGSTSVTKVINVSQIPTKSQ